MARDEQQTMSALERDLWQETPLYNLMCDVVNGDRSDWPTGYGEPSHVDYMLGKASSEQRSGGDGA